MVCTKEHEQIGPVKDENGKYRFTYEDFTSGRVCEYITGIDGWKRTVAEDELAKLAKSVGFNKFSAGLKEYRRDLKWFNTVNLTEGISEFGEQPFELNTGDWTADEDGVWRYGNGADRIWACSHPVMPVKRMRSVDTGLVKVQIAFRRGYASKKTWNTITVPNSKISKASDIIALSDCGISVTSGERAQALVDYLRDVLDRNEALIPEVRSVSRMGWNEEGFSPYVGDIVFDSADSFRPAYAAIRQTGTLEQWLEEALDARRYSTTARIVLAASFASVLVEPLGCLPFFIHLWGMGSGTGKTVGQMLGASVWADPTVGGDFFQTFRSTSVGIEMMAGFLHSLPLFLDELQLSKDRHGQIVFNVYELASGSGKLRSNVSLGLNYTPKWSNCFITSGETPIVSETDGAGALNRVIEIECKPYEKVIENGHRTANALKANYGHAGKLFVDRLCAGGIDEAKRLYEERYADCMKSDTTEKQAMAAAIILTADALATEWIFQDGRSLTPGDLGEFLKSKSSVSLSDRGYELLCDWVAENANQFQKTVDRGEHYGIVEDGVAYINRSVFNRICSEHSIAPKALLSNLKAEGKTIAGQKGYTRTKKIDGMPVHCVCLKLPEDDGLPDSEYDELPL